jgi:hypothetical protein
VTNIKDVDRILADGEYDPMMMCPLAASAIQQFADFLVELVVLRGERAAGRMAPGHLDFLDQAVIPACGDGGGCVLGLPSNGGPNLALGRWLDDDAVGHASGCRLNSRRRSANAAVCVALLEDLQARGLDASRPVLL